MVRRLPALTLHQLGLFREQNSRTLPLLRQAMKAHVEELKSAQPK